MNMSFAKIALAALLFAPVVLANPSKIRRHTEAIPNEYFVVLPERTPVAATEGISRSLAAAYGLTVITVWPEALRGFLVSAPQSSIDALVGDPRVEFVEQNFSGTADVSVSGTVNTDYQGQYLWHLDRIDEVNLTDHDMQYNMCTDASDVFVYVLNDSGIYEGHREFANSYIEQWDFWGDGNNGTWMPTGPCRPGVGGSAAFHGTAVASAVGGGNIGSARVKFISLRAMTCGGQYRASDAIEAVAWIEAHRYYPSVITQSSFFHHYSEGFDTYSRAVKLTVQATQIPFFKSADNFSTDACKFSPNINAYTRVNRTGTIFVVGGTAIDFQTWTDPNDYRWQFYGSDGVTPLIGPGSGSNGGSCVSGYAPATQFYVASHQAFDSYQRVDGTSFAAPLVAGIAARYISKTFRETRTIPSATQVYDWLLANSTKPVQMTQTAPTYWACVTNNLAQTSRFVKTPTCLSTERGPYIMPNATNTSDARMIYWDEGICP